MIRLRTFLVVGLLVAFVLAGVVSGFASPAPDGLEKVAADKGFGSTARTHDLDGSPVAGYQVTGVGDNRVATGLAGAIGVVSTLVVGGGCSSRCAVAGVVGPGRRPCRRASPHPGRSDGGRRHGVHQLFVPRRSPVHALPAHVKLAAAAAFVLVVVSTPYRQLWAFAGYAVLLVGTSVIARSRC